MISAITSMYILYIYFCSCIVIRGPGCVIISHDLSLAKTLRFCCLMYSYQINKIIGLPCPLQMRIRSSATLCGLDNALLDCIP